MVAESPRQACRPRVRSSGSARWLLAFLVLGLLPFTPGALDARLMDPYRVAVPVPDQSAGARRMAEREGLERVLIRLTGASEFGDRPEIEAALGNPARYFVQSGYARIRDAEMAAAHPEARWVLELEADRQSVLRLLTEARIPAWTGHRPEILVVMLREADDGERLLVEPDAPEARRLLEAARERGLPVVLPLFDLQDRLAADTSALWGRFEEATEPLVLRYRPDAVLIVRIYQDALGGWLADWSGEVAGERFDASAEVDAPEAATPVMVEQLAARLTARYALRMGSGSDGGEWLWLQVDDLREVDAYAGMMRYLGELSAVDRVQLVQIRDSSLLLRIESTDAVARLLDVLRLEARLTPRGAPEYVGDEPVWRAQWRTGGG